MRFLDNIIDYILDVAGFFLDLKHEVEDWVWPFYYAAPFFLDVADAFAHLAYQFGKFNDWVDDATDIIKDILNLDEIKDALGTWLDYATWAWDWISDAWANVKEIVVDWWGTVIATVIGWIDEAKEELLTLIDALEELVNSILADVEELLAQIPDVSEITAWFSDWWGNILANLDGWWSERLGDIQSLIDTAIADIAPTLDGWQDIRDKVFEFFDDPLEWLLNRFTDWFLGPEV